MSAIVAECRNCDWWCNCVTVGVGRTATKGCVCRESTNYWWQVDGDNSCDQFSGVKARAEQRLQMRCVSPLPMSVEDNDYLPEPWVVRPTPSDIELLTEELIRCHKAGLIG